MWFLGAFDRPQCFSSSSYFGIRSGSATQLHHPWQGSSSTSRSSTVSFGGLPSPYDCNTLPTTPTSSRSRDTFLDLSTETSNDEATQPLATTHNHWCFTCPNPRVITTCDGWKRHMKEHETRYRCMPRGPIEYTADGAKCAFCGFQNPSQSHCNIHKAFPCANRSLDVRSYTRKPHFIIHLRTHDISNVAVLADHWKDTINKKHFSCGFCISHFNSLIEQLNHIDVAHYRLLHHIGDWDPNKVIRGLLLQPGVSESWRRILALHPGLVESLLRWDLAVIKTLQPRLEVGNESADVLADLAFNESTYGLSHHGGFEMLDAPRLSHCDGAAAPQEAPVIQAPAPIRFNLGEMPIVDGDEMTSSASQTEPWSSTRDSMFPHNSFLLRGCPDEAEDNAAMRYPSMRHPQLDASQNCMTSGDNYPTQSASSLYTPWTSSNSFDSNLLTQSSPMTGNYWQNTAISSPTNSSSVASCQSRYQSQHCGESPR